MKLKLPLALILAVSTLATSPSVFATEPSQGEHPTDPDLAKVIGEKNTVEFVDRLLSLVEDEIIPTTEKGVSEGNKLFGAAVLKKDDLSTVIVGTNTETGNPLMHGEVAAIFNFYDIPTDKRPGAKETIFFATHEPCPLCLASIAWGGWDNFVYLFTYQDTKDAFNIPHDLRMHEEIFNVKDGKYRKKNLYFNSWSVSDLIAMCPSDSRKGFETRLEAIRKAYDDMSETYQKSKGQGAEIPLD